MKANTALCFVLAGISLLLLRGTAPSSRRIHAMVLAAVVALTGSVTLAEYLSGYNFGIDELLFRDATVDEFYGPPGRMARMTALGFTLVGTALLFLGLNSQRSTASAQLFALLAGLNALLVLAGFVYGAPELIDIITRGADRTQMGIAAAITFLILSLGMLAARPQSALVANLTSGHAGGQMMRRLLPVVLTLPFVVGWLRMLGELHGLYDTRLGIALYATSNVVLFTGTIWLVARSLNRMDYQRESEMAHRREAEAAFRQVSATFDSTLEHLREGFQIIDREWRYVYVNPVAAQHGRRAPQELLRQRMMDVFPGIDGTPMFAVLRHCMENRERRHMENEFFHEDGSCSWFELVIEPVPEGLFILSLDISERKKAEAAVRESERRFSDMLRNLDLISIMLDCDARLVYCNDYFLKLTGWQEHEVIGRNWFDLFVPGEALDDVQKRFRDLIADMPEAWHHANEIVTRSGEARMIHWSNTVLRSASGEVVGAASIGEDVTERLRAEAAAREYSARQVRAQRLESIGTLASGIAHDLNNMLMPILIGVGVLRRHSYDERSLRTIENIDRSVKRGTELVKQILLFARGIEGTRAPVHLGHVIAEVHTLAVSTFPKNIAVHIEIADDLDVVNGDVTQLNQVILNLCVNARDAMPRGGRITISAQNVDLDQDDVRLGAGVAGKYVKVEVTDTGVGMPPQVIDHMFEPFFTTKEIGRGTGLGLSTVQGIVKSHGGFIRASSQLGKGSTFSLCFPVAADEQRLRDSETAEPRKGEGQWILVVEDEESVLGMIKETLQTFGYQVLMAESGEQALKVYGESHGTIALVLTDLMLPGMDGEALVAKLRQIDPIIPIIAVSVLTERQPAAEAAGVTRFLPKPYTAEALLRSIAEVIEQKTFA